MMLKTCKTKGFSLMELALTVAILTILALVSIAAYNHMEKAAHMATEKSTVAAVTAGITAYYVAHNKTYPETLDDVTETGIATLGNSKIFDTVLLRTPGITDPWYKSDATTYVNKHSTNSYCYDSIAGSLGSCNDPVEPEPVYNEAGQLLLSNDPVTLYNTYDDIVRYKFGVSGEESFSVSGELYNDNSLAGTLFYSYNASTRELTASFSDANGDLIKERSKTFPQDNPLTHVGFQTTGSMVFIFYYQESGYWTDVAMTSDIDATHGTLKFLPNEENDYTITSMEIQQTGDPSLKTIW